MLIVGCVSQKGGVGKSCLARLIGREYAEAGWRLRIADLDTKQGTTLEWARIRVDQSQAPRVEVAPYKTAREALASADGLDMLVIDGQPNASKGTLDVARAAHTILLPTGLGVDDLRPQVMLAHELVSHGVPAARIGFVLCRAGDSAPELLEARRYVREAGYPVLGGELPERTGYRRAHDQGRAVTEAAHPALREKAERVAQAIVKFISERMED